LSPTRRVLKNAVGLVGQTFLSDGSLCFCSKMTGKNACPTGKIFFQHPARKAKLIFISA
jgi:hypothetical protein